MTHQMMLVYVLLVTSDSVVFCGASTTSVFDGELSRLIGASGASHTSLGASLPARVHQWLRCGCLQDHGF